MKTTIFGIELGNTGWTNGCENAPEIINKAIKEYCPDLYNTTKYESIGFQPGLSTEYKLSQIEIKYKILLTQNERILSVGGDHLISYPLLKVLSEEKKDIVYIYLDAHHDFYDDEPFYNWNVARKIKNIGVKVVNIGFRNFLDEKIEQGMNCIPFKYDFDLNNFKKELAYFIKKDKTIYFSIDLDILEPLIFPHVNSPVSCGILPRELFQIIEHVLTSYKPNFIDICEYNPQKDLAGTGKEFVRSVIDFIMQNWR